MSDEGEPVPSRVHLIKFRDGEPEPRPRGRRRRRAVARSCPGGRPTLTSAPKESFSATQTSRPRRMSDDVLNFFEEPSIPALSFREASMRTVAGARRRNSQPRRVELFFF